MTPTLEHLQRFELARRRLRSLAYRMLGSRTEAEDVIQDCWLRWQNVDHATVRDPGAFLEKIAIHLCLDRLSSARQQRERYVGLWLPEPLVEEADAYSAAPESKSEYAEEVGIAFMLALERLSILERAAFLLHDVFDLDFDQVAQRLGRSSNACRQLASRARVHVRAEHVRVQLAEPERKRLLTAFQHALEEGDIDSLARTLTEDAEFMSDGGGNVPAVPKTLRGGLRIAKTLIGFARFIAKLKIMFRPARINGLEGGVFYEFNGAPLQTIAFRFAHSGRIRSIYVVRNPEKLLHVPHLDHIRLKLKVG